MARKVQKLLIVSVLVIVLGLPAVVWGQAAVEQMVTLALASGEALPAGSYTVTVNLPDGSQVEGQIQVAGDAGAVTQPGAAQPEPTAPAAEQPAAAAEPAAAGQTPAETGFPLPLVLGLVGGVVALIAAGLFVYFKVISPKRQLDPYQKALQLLRDKEYAAALPELTRVEGKLPDELRSECRFFIAFTRQRLNKLDQAVNDLETLLEEDPRNVDVAYLLAYIYLQKDDLRKAEAVLEKMEKDNQLGYRDAKKLLGIVKFRRAYIELKEGRVDAAQDLFDKVKQLGDFASQIPGDLRDRNLLLGTKALFDHNTQEARTLFNRLISDLGADGAKSNPALLASAKVGLALADWIDNKDCKDVEEQLVEAARLMDPRGKLHQAWRSSVEASGGLADQLEALDGEGEPAVESPSQVEKSHQRMLRDIHFLRGMNHLREWAHMDGKEAYDQIEQRLKTVLETIACARELDAKFSDVYLVAGLLLYYLHKQGQPERGQGIDLLQEAQRLGMREPTALEIINHREKARQANKGAIDSYLQMLDKYINDVTVRKDIRIQLMEQRRRYRRVRTPEKRPDPGSLRTVEPTVAEMQHRTEVLLARVGQILSEQPKSETIDLAQLCAQIQQGSEALVKQAQSIETTEAALLEKTGNRLFRD